MDDLERQTPPQKASNAVPRDSCGIYTNTMSGSRVVLGEHYIPQKVF